MRFKEFLIEGKFTSSLRHNKKTNIIKFISDNCSEYLKNNSTPIYRGFMRDSKKVAKSWYIVEPSKHERTSKGDAKGNVYTLLIDSLPEWQNFPKRSKSMICSTNYSYAGNFGSPHLVIPFDGAKWGVCIDNDIWHSFKHAKNTLGIYRIDEINRELIDTVEMLHYWVDEIAKPLNKFNIKKIIKSRDPKELWDFLKVLDSVIKQVKPDDLKDHRGYIKPALLHSFITFMKKYGSIQKMISVALNPEYNEFELLTNKDVLPEDREVWTDSNCVLIDVYKFIDDVIKPSLENKYIKLKVDSPNAKTMEEIDKIEMNPKIEVLKWIKEQI